MRWRAICERRFERVIGDRTGFVSLDSNTDQPLDGPPGPAVSPIARAALGPMPYGNTSRLPAGAPNQRLNQRLFSCPTRLCPLSWLSKTSMGLRQKVVPWDSLKTIDNGNPSRMGSTKSARTPQTRVCWVEFRCGSCRSDEMVLLCIQKIIKNRYFS